jgi:hypothetical protein
VAQLAITRLAIANVMNLFICDLTFPYVSTGVVYCRGRHRY